VKANIFSGYFSFLVICGVAQSLFKSFSQQEMETCICVNCNNKCSPRYSQYFCSEHLKQPTVPYKITMVAGKNEGHIPKTEYFLKKVGHTFMVQRRKDGLLQSRDKVEIIRMNLLFSNIEGDSEVICPACGNKENSLSLEEYTCGHFYHQECCPAMCVVCLERGKAKIEHRTTPEIIECVICYSNVLEKPLECGHSVHRRCVARWGSTSCPICRAPTVLPEQYKWLLDKIKENRMQESIRQDHDVAVQLQRRFGDF
jgi:Ring finger domain